MTGRKLTITWFYFAGGIVYLTVSCVIIAFTVNYYSLLSLITLWPALCSFYMFLACFANNPHMLGKNPKTGKIDKSMTIMLFPLFSLLWMYWLARKSSTKESIYDEIVPGIYLGCVHSQIRLQFRDASLFTPKVRFTLCSGKAHR